MTNCTAILLRMVFFRAANLAFVLVSLQSTVTALLEATDRWATNIDRGILYHGYKPDDWSPSLVSADSVTLASLSTEK